MSNGPLSSVSCSLMDASEAAAGDGAGGAAGGGAPVDVIEVPSSSAGGAVSGSQRPDSAPSLPDLGIPVRQALHHLPEVTCGDAPLSFRRFLASSQQQQQLQLAVSPSLSPAVVSSTGSACRPDVAAGLPDFVRDDPHEQQQQQQLAAGAAAGGVASEAAVATLSGDRQRPAALCVARSSQVRLSARVAPTPVRQPPSVGRLAPLDRPCTAASSASNTASPPPSSSSCSSFSSAALSCQQQQLPSPSSQPNAALSGRAGLPDFLSNTTSASAASSASAAAAAASDGGGGGGCMAAGSADLTAERHSVSLLAQRVTQLEQENTDLRCSLSRLRRQLTAELERSADLESRLRGVDTASLSPAAPTAAPTAAAAAAAGGSGVPVCHQQASSSHENAAVAHLLLTANQSESLISELRESVRALRDAATLLQQHAPSDTSNNNSNSNNQQPPTPQQ